MLCLNWGDYKDLTDCLVFDIEVENVVKFSKNFIYLVGELKMNCID